MKEHDYNIYSSNCHTTIRRSVFLEKDNCLRIEWMSDTPSKTQILYFIKKEYPELLDKLIERVYYDPEWISEWNVGKQKGCFGLILVFYKEEL